MNIDYKYNYSESELVSDWKKLCDIKEYKNGAQFKPGMKLCQHFFPNFWNIKNEKNFSFSDAWNNPEIMDKVRIWGLRGMSQLWLSWIRRAVFLTAGLPNSSFYRPHFAKQIISFVDHKKNGTLFDPCAGWGGRLLGTVSCNWHYVACEPNIETYNNLIKMIDFLGVKKYVTIYNIPAENFDYNNMKNIDIVLTSPPYFNLEKYSKEENQSYNKYQTYDIWEKKWLQPLVYNCQNILKKNGLSCWNVMNFGKYNLVNTILNSHSEKKWLHITNLGFDSPLANIRNLKNKDVTYIFKKI